jgi:hypothetical protein
MLGEDLEPASSPADSLSSQLGIGSRCLRIGDCPRFVRNSAATRDDLKSQVEIFGQRLGRHAPQLPKQVGSMGAHGPRRDKHSAGAGVLGLLDQCLAVIVFQNLKAAYRPFWVKQTDLAGHGPNGRVGQWHEQMP